MVNGLAFNLMNNDDRAAMLILFLCSFAMSLYIFLNPTEVRKANQSERYKRFGFGSKPIWFFRVFGLLGIILNLFLLYTVFHKPS
jgi:hypothetical protein